jgi:hypothetical protein
LDAPTFLTKKLYWRKDMKKRLFITMVVAMLALLPLSSAFSSEVFKTTTEMIQWDPDRAYNGYTLFNGFGAAQLLVDMEGNVVHSWSSEDMNVFYSYLIENGNLRRHGAMSYSPTGAIAGSTASLLTAGGSSGRVEEVAWDGTVVFGLDAFDGTPVPGDPTAPYTLGTFRQHHDSQRVWNEALGQYTWMVLAWMVKGPTDADVMGVDDAHIALSRNGFSPDAIMEFTYDGELVWQWNYNDHMVTDDPSATGTVDVDGWTDHYGRQNAGVALMTSGDFSDYYGKLNVNGVHYTQPSGPRNDYQHCNSFDYDENTGYVAINAKAASEFMVVDHDGTFMLTAADLTGVATTGGAIITVGNAVGADARTSDGDFLYRFGNPSNYDSGDAPGYDDQGDQQMFGTHDIQWIQKFAWRPDFSGQSLWPDPTAAAALPGAGDFLMFDNACYDPVLAGSVIIQVDPYETGGTGTADTTTLYVDPATAGYLTGGGGGPGAPPTNDSKQITWRFGGGGGFGGLSPINDFYSWYISGAQRQPNGNTLICSGSMGHLFEVTEAGSIVWEYVVPQAAAPGPPGSPRTVVTSLNQGFGNSTFRAHRYASTYPGLAGRDLTPGATATGRLPGSLDQYPDTTPAPAPTGWGTSGLTVSGDGGGGSAGGTGTGGGSSY